MDLKRACQSAATLLKGVVTYIYSNVVSWEFPGVKVEPVIGNLNLVTVDDFLLEDAISVPQAVAPGGVAQGSQAVEEARREPAEAAVSEACIMLLLNDVFDPEAKVGEARFTRVSQNSRPWPSRHGRSGTYPLQCPFGQRSEWRYPTPSP